MKLGHPCLYSMKAIPSTVHKCLKFLLHDKIITFNHIMYQPMVRRGNVILDYFWNKQFQPSKPRSDSIFQSYQNLKNDMILSLRKPRDPNFIPLIHDIPILPPHDGLGLLHIPSITPLYTIVPPPTSHKGKLPESPICQPKKHSSMHPYLNEEKNPMPIDPKPSKPLAKTKTSC